MATNAEREVRDLVLEKPAAARVFEKFGIDYCCGGSQTLGDACKAAHRSVEEVTAEIEKSEPAPTERDWRNASLTELAEYIVDKHHTFTQTEINRLTDLIAKVVTAHGKNHPELARVQSIFEGLSQELRMHMTKEEQLLFPYIADMEEAARLKRRPPMAMFGTVQNPVAAMIMEHEASGQQLEKMREITNGYSVPPDACMSYRTLFQALPAFEADLHQHIHLENNILFPRSVDLESELS
ncbi:MAG TPA: iron-sulfur cluster repair di-iron protein [Candidatus Polarisedimenticolia bacterium]|nr:iron-sulfur cluster repair di-iron protein [Candidatus Polarisedimenticolia bacterium]